MKSDRMAPAADSDSATATRADEHINHADKHLYRTDEHTNRTVGNANTPSQRADAPLTPAGLPCSVEGLRAALHQGELTIGEALARQQQALRQDAWHCVVDVPELARAMVPAASLPLAGVGLAHKDIFMFGAHMPACGVGAPPAGWVPTGESTVLARLAAAGSLPLAWLDMAPYACGATAENERAPVMRNPLDDAAAVGGSSSGSAVAVAAGLCYGSLGTDTAGSVRMPAATCGLVGLKTTAGLLPDQGVVPLAPSLDTVGVLARCSADTLEIFAATLTDDQARDLRERHAADCQGPLRVAACFTHANADIRSSPEVAQALDAFAAEMAAAPRIAIGSQRELQRLADIVLHAEAATTHHTALRGSLPLPRAVRHMALNGAALPPEWYAQALQQRSAHQDAFIRHVLGEADILLTPALPAGVPDVRAVTSTSPDFQPRQLLAMFSWMSFVNYLGLPAVVVPIARDSRGHPICVQAIARPAMEGTLLAFVSRIEQLRPDAFSSLTSFSQNNETCLN